MVLPEGTDGDTWHEQFVCETGQVERIGPSADRGHGGKGPGTGLCEPVAETSVQV